MKFQRHLRLQLRSRHLGLPDVISKVAAPQSSAQIWGTQATHAESSNVLASVLHFTTCPDKLLGRLRVSKFRQEYSEHGDGDAIAVIAAIAVVVVVGCCMLVALAALVVLLVHSVWAWGALLAITLSLRGISFARKFLRTSCNARISHSTW